MVLPVASAYLWVKAAHMVAVIAWMAGILYLPRLFVYHADAGIDAKQASTFKTMERRLFFVIMWPAMVVTFATGGVLVWILWDSGIRESGWAMVKLVSVLIMAALHIRLGWHMRAFQEDRNLHASGYFRLLNEVPTALLILIVIMVVVKPF